MPIEPELSTTKRMSMSGHDPSIVQSSGSPVGSVSGGSSVVAPEVVGVSVVVAVVESSTLGGVEVVVVVDSPVVVMSIVVPPSDMTGSRIHAVKMITLVPTARIVSIVSSLRMFMVMVARLQTL
ncbi:MAG: hypothetical protein AAGF11_02035 [Myxococcota bacterium]